MDWHHIIDEMEASGRSELRAVRSFIGLVLLHALKLHAYPEHPSARHWRQERLTLLEQAREGYQPSMAQHLDVTAVHERARRQVIHDYPQMAAPQPMPGSIDLAVSPMMAADFSVDDMLGLLRGA